MQRSDVALAILFASFGAAPVACEPVPWLSRILHPTAARVNEHWIADAYRESWKSPADIRHWIRLQDRSPNADYEELEILGLFLAVVEQQPHERKVLTTLYDHGCNCLSSKDPYVKGMGIRVLKYVTVRYPSSPSAFYAKQKLREAADGANTVFGGRPRTGTGASRKLPNLRSSVS